MIAAGGTLGAIMMPPPTVLAVYAVITQQDVGKLFMAGVLPWPAGDGHGQATIIAYRRACAKLLPAGEKRALERAPRGDEGRLALAGAVHLRDRRPVRRRLPRPPRPAAWAGGRFLLGVIRRKLDRAGIPPKAAANHAPRRRYSRC